MYLLDTNVWSALVNGASAAVIERIASESPDRLILSSVVWAELLYGWNKKGRPRRLGQSLAYLLDRYSFADFDASCADAYGTVRAELETAGHTIGANDCLIAATALANDLIVVTHNVREFARVPGLRVEDWQTDRP